MFPVQELTNQRPLARWDTLDIQLIAWELDIDIEKQTTHQHLMDTHFPVCVTITHNSMSYIALHT